MNKELKTTFQAVGSKVRMDGMRKHFMRNYAEMA